MHDNTELQNDTYLPVRWRLTSRARMLHGSLRLTASHRLELRLTNGKLVFSAPVALTRRKYEPRLLVIRIVVGPQLYVLSVISPSSDQKTVAEIFSERSNHYLAWRNRVETEATDSSVDDAPLIAVPSNGIFASRRKKARLAIWAIYAKIAALAVIGITALVFSWQVVGNNSPLALLSFLVLGVVSFVLYPRFIKAFERQSLAAFDEHHLSPDELQVRPEETLPVDTKPSRSYGMTAGRAAALILIPFPLYIIVLFMIIGVLVSSL